ncbi:MAG: peptidoglycan editing factor PgeF [Salinibacter sp.]|uniref:peptidoglycan editing factor PgeF n=1 Tax=Salinibacter sp. TaxID=2065818 RepID=UPI002FC2A5DA
MPAAPTTDRSPLLRPRIFADVPSVTAGMSTRHGGVSGPPYDTLNLGRHVGDTASCVEENRRRFCAALHTDPAWLATAGQVHGSTVRVIDAPRHEPFCDGLVTTTPGLLLAIAVADCAPVLLADPEHEVVGACHAGWRGTVRHIAAHTVATMADRGADPAQVRAYVGPCLSREAFEVGPEVAAQFDDAVVSYPEADGRPHVDLKAALRRQLEGAGVPGAAIEESSHCTLQDTDTFFSHRASEGDTGRMFGAIVLRH